jgi:hypothetical protein
MLDTSRSAPGVGARAVELLVPLSLLQKDHIGNANLFCRMSEGGAAKQQSHIAALLSDGARAVYELTCRFPGRWRSSVRRESVSSHPNAA